MKWHRIKGKEEYIANLEIADDQYLLCMDCKSRIIEEPLMQGNHVDEDWQDYNDYTHFCIGTYPEYCEK